MIFVIWDLRSDTVTKPCAAMRTAMATAEVGDDVMNEDPTVHALESYAAELTGHEAALFVVSGTMGNQICIATASRPGDAILAEEEAHILFYEVGGTALNAGVVTWTFPSLDGAPSPAHVASKIMVADLHHPGTRMICLENTHNRKGGRVLPVDRVQQFRSLADHHGLHLHLDGARAANAAVASGVPLREITGLYDSVSLCLSKGLGAPVGSVIAGRRDFIERARRVRKRLGGGLRQAGILAAAGLFALQKNIERLADDHRLAREIALGLVDLPGLQVNPAQVETNLVLIHTETAAEQWQTQLQEIGILCYAVDPHRLRLVTHKDVSAEAATAVPEGFRTVAARLTP